MARKICFKCGSSASCTTISILSNQTICLNCDDEELRDPRTIKILQEKREKDIAYIGERP